MVPFLAPLAPIAGALFKLILLGSLKFGILLTGMFIAPVWTEKKLRQFTYGAAHKGLKELFDNGLIEEETWVVVDTVILKALSQKHGTTDARKILRKKISATVQGIWSGIKEVPGDLSRMAQSIHEFIKRRMK